MKNCKRFATMALATAIVTGNVFTVMAAEGGSTGTGDYEGYVEETSVFTVDVPTDASATAGFNFFVDPNGLLASTNYARISGATAADFESGASLFFTRTPDANASPAIVKYGKDSDKITFTNKSSYAVDVEVSATVTGADEITLGEVAADTTTPTIKLAIVSGANEALVTAEGAKLTGTIDGDTDNFAIKWNSTEGKYEYSLIDTPDDTKWKTYSFNLTGACGGTWTAAQAEVQPAVNLTWKVTDPKATPADDYVMTAAANGDISYTFGAKPEGSTITVLKINGTDRIGAYTAGNATYNATTGVFTVKSVAATNTGLANGGNVELKIGDETFTLTYTKE